MGLINQFIDPIANALPKIPVALMDLVVGIIIIKIVIFLLRRAIKLIRIPQDLRGLIITVSRLVLDVMLIIFIASQLGLGDLAVLLSGSAVVLVFFLNTSAGPLLANIFSGLSLISDPDFSVGMHVITNDGKTEGEVVGIDMRKVRIRDKDGQMHIVPNTVVENGEWVIVGRKKK